jgi:dTDP-4-dehydrorhamnose reductase
MRARRLTVTGARGQLGRAIVGICSENWLVDRIASAETDIRNWNQVRDRIAAFQPDLVIHAAAATDVDGCEAHPQFAYEINALGTRNVAQAAAQVDAEIVYVSTNYVFNGEKSDPYHEYDHTKPLSVYGASKLAGEREAMAATYRCHVVRTAWLYDAEGSNFVRTMSRLMAERDHLTVVADQFGNPTYATDLASAIISVVDRAPFGVHHVTNAGVASWFEWACEIAALSGSSTTIEPIPATAWPRPARPPANGAMQSLTLPMVGIQLPDWRDALRRCLGA